MSTFSTILVIIGMFACGLGVSWLYIDAYNNLLKIKELEKAEAEYCPSAEEDESEE